MLRAAWIPNTCASVPPSPQWGWGGQTPDLGEMHPQNKQACLLNPTEECGGKNDSEEVQVFAVEALCQDAAASRSQCRAASPQLITCSVCCRLGSRPWGRQGTRVAEGQVSTHGGLDLRRAKEARPTRARSQIFMPWTRPCLAPGAEPVPWETGAEKGGALQALPESAAMQCAGCSAQGRTKCQRPWPCPEAPSRLFLAVTAFGEHIFRCQAAHERRKYFI